MAITRKDFKRGTNIAVQGLSHHFLVPYSDDDEIADMTITAAEWLAGVNIMKTGTVPTGKSWNAATMPVGATAAYAGTIPIPNCGVSFTMTATGSSTACRLTLLVSGYNQFGVEVSETVNLSTAAGTPVIVHTVNAYAALTGIVIQSPTGIANTDVLDIGFVTGVATNQLPIGLPIKIDSAADILGVIGGDPSLSIGFPTNIENLDLDNYYTFELDAAVFTNGGQFQMMFRPGCNML